MRTFRLVSCFVAVYSVTASFSSAIFIGFKSRPSLAAGVTDFPSVTRWAGIDRYYQGLRATSLGSRPLEPSNDTIWNTRAEVKKKICKSVFTSSFFEMRSEEYLNVDDEQVRAELMGEEYRRIFQSIYILDSRGGKDNYVYENTYKTQTISVGNVVGNEYTITCLVRSAGRIEEYFVTRLYNVNVTHNGLPMLGRFVFSRNTAGDLVLLALAEESAVETSSLRKTSLLEMTYVTTREKDRRAGSFPTTEETDPVCRLTPANKLRLCSSLFSATSFKLFSRREPLFTRDELKFTPVLDREDDSIGCVRKQVSFTTPGWGSLGGWLTQMILRFNHSQTYQDWMVACRASTPEGDPIVYYVSRGAKKNDAYAFTDADVEGQVALFNIFLNMSVVIEANYSDTEEQEDSLGIFIHPDAED